jgi:hypothetical protein
MVEKLSTTYLSEKKKRYWPMFPFHIGQYSLMNKNQVEKEEETLKELCLCLGNKKGHDPQNLVYEHMRVFKMAPQLVHEVNFAEDIFRELYILKKC